MRGIKFRAWATTAVDGWNGDNFERSWSMWYPKKYGLQSVSFTNEGEPELLLLNGMITRSFQLMQYTGLKDKNGKTIYEGDIVTNHGVTNDLKRREFEVVWNDVNARFSLHDIRANLRTSIDLDSASECEVIGNVFENQELPK